MSPPTALNTPPFERRSPKPLSWVLSHQRKPGLKLITEIDAPRRAFLRLRWRQINFAEKGEKGKEEGEGRGRKEEGRKEGV